MHDPETYENNKHIVNLAAAEIFPIFEKTMKWTSGENLLDYGCGPGGTTFLHVLPLAKKYGSKIHGMDISSAMIEYAQKFNGSPDIEYSVGDIMNDLVQAFKKDEFYDKIVSFFVLHWIKDYREAMNRFYSILKPNGYVAFTLVVSNCAHFHLVGELGRSSKWGQYTEGYQQFIPDWIEHGTDPDVDIRKCLMNCGFKILKFVQTPLKLVNRDFEVTAELLMSLNPFLNKIPSHLHPELREERKVILRKFCNLKAEQDKFDLTVDVISFVAQKPK